MLKRNEKQIKLGDTLQVCKSFNYLGFNGMANAGAVSRSCRPELINAVFFFANATVHRAGGGSQATGLESAVLDWPSMIAQTSCLDWYDFMAHN